MREVTVEDISCKGQAKQVIGLVPGEIITTDAGVAKDYDLENDIIKVVVIESHKGTMHMGTAYLKGMGLKKELLAQQLHMIHIIWYLQEQMTKI